jgi:hypothetical protein
MGLQVKQSAHNGAKIAPADCKAAQQGQRILSQGPLYPDAKLNYNQASTLQIGESTTCLNDKHPAERVLVTDAGRQLVVVECDSSED